jgi:protein-S-isoprenylcysteine O-methyltransferase Ste14
MENSTIFPKQQPSGVHKILAHSYSMHLILFLAGVVLDVVFRFKIFEHPVLLPTGAFFLAFGSVLILWAQSTSRHLDIGSVTKETFLHGPYRFTRTPTNFGLLFLSLGFGIVANALFVILTSFAAFFIAKLIFLKKQEQILADKYGVPYLEYKKSVKF